MKAALAAIFVTALVAGSTSAALITDYTDMGNLSSTISSRTNSLTVAAGDVIVMVAGSNKKASVTSISFTSPAGTFIDLDANTQLGNDPNPNAYLSYLTIGTGGTYDFVGSGDTLTANLGIYKLAADSGVIELADTNAKRYGNLAAGASLSVTNFMSWGGNPNSGDYDGMAVIGVASSLRGTVSTASLILDEDNAGKRLAGIAGIAGMVNYRTIWDITNADATRNESGGMTGAAFAEVIPEPATLTLLGLGALALLRRRHRT